MFVGSLRLMPKSWKTDVVVIRGGGRDSRGNPKTPERIPVTDCLLAPRSTAEPLDHSDIVNSVAVLYHESFKFLPSDRVEVPEASRMSGLWAVEGRPSEWPYGIEVGLVRA